MINLELTRTQFNSLQGILLLFDIRAKEPVHKKQTTINYNTVSKVKDIDYKCVRTSLNNLNKKIKDIKL